MPHQVPSSTQASASDPQVPRGVTVRLRGSDRRGGRVRLADFLGFFGAVRMTLVHVDRIVSGGDRAADYVIADLHMSTPAVEILPVPRPNMPDSAAQIPGRWVGALHDIQVDGRRPVGFDDSALEAFGKLSRQLGTGVSAADVAYGDLTAEITPQIHEAVERILGETTTSLGSVSGSLDAINAHAQNTFYIYPAVSPGRIPCRFPKEMIPEAGAALTRHVTVEGLMHYRAGEALPKEVEVQQLIVHPREDELPTLGSLRGSAPDMTGGMTSVQFVRSLRDAE